MTRGESMSLAFIAALQQLPPRQRSALVLQDVLGYPAREVAEILETSTESVSSALKRARRTLGRQVPLPSPGERPPAPASAEEQRLLAALVAAYEKADVDALVALLTEDVWMTMPPIPLEYQGRDLCGRFMSVVAFRPGRSFKLVPTRANGQPAFGMYLVDKTTGMAHANGLLVFTLAGGLVSAIARFENNVLPRFGLPRTIDA